MSFYDRYNKVMLYFWLAVGILITIVVTFKGIQDGFELWAFYYLFAGLAFLSFFLRRFMMKRAEKHQQFLKEQAEKEQ